MSHTDGISNWRLVIFCVGFACLFHLSPNLAAAQSPEELADVQAKVKAGDTVRVTEANGNPRRAVSKDSPGTPFGWYGKAHL